MSEDHEKLVRAFETGARLGAAGGQGFLGSGESALERAAFLEGYQEGVSVRNRSLPDLAEAYELGNAVGRYRRKFRTAN